MRKSLIFLLGIFFVISCSKDMEVSGTLTTQVRTVTDYTKISVADGISVKINRGTKGEVTVRTFTSVFDYVQTSVENNTLIIKVIDKTQFDRNPNITVTLSADMITSLDISGNSNVTAENTFFADNKGDLFITGGSSYKGNIATKDLSMILSGGSTSEINGTATNAEIRCDGGSTIDGKIFQTDFLDIALSAGSSVYIKVVENINKALLTGRSKLYYKGPKYSLEAVKLDGDSKIYDTF